MLLHQCDLCSEIIPGPRFHFQGTIYHEGSIPGCGTLPHKVGKDFCSIDCLKIWVGDHKPKNKDIDAPVIDGVANIVIISGGI